MINTQRLPASKKRIYEILQSSIKGNDVLQTIANNNNIVRRFTTIKSFFENKKSLLSLLGVIADGVDVICEYILTNYKDNEDLNINMNNVQKLNADVYTIVSKFFKDFTNINDLDTIKNFIGELDNEVAIDTTGDLENLDDLSIFKQIHTIMYNFILACVGKGRNIAQKEYKDSDNLYVPTQESYISKDIKAKVAAADKKTDTIIDWICTRWNWTLPICCIDKIIHVIDYGKAVIPINCFSGNLYRFKLLGSILKCSADSFLGCYEFGYVSNNGGIFRTSRSILNDGTGLYIDVRPSNKLYNFRNLKAKGDISDQKFYYRLYYNGSLISIDDVVGKYNTGDIKTSPSVLFSTKTALENNLKIQEQKQQETNFNNAVQEEVNKRIVQMQQQQQQQQLQQQQLQQQLQPLQTQPQMEVVNI